METGDKKNGNRRKYDREFKFQAVKMVEGGRRVCDVAENLGIHPNQLSAWKRSCQKDGPKAFPGIGKMVVHDEE